MDRGLIYTERIRLVGNVAVAYKVYFYCYVFNVVVTSEISAVRLWISSVTNMDLYPESSYQTGKIPATFTLLWPHNALVNEENHRPATIQICTKCACLVFQIARAGHTIPSPIREFLEDHRFVFFAWPNFSDHQRLYQYYGVRAQNQREILQLPVDMNERRVMAEEVVLQQLRCPVSFPEDVFLSRWDAPELSIEQVQYAALEACLARQIATGLL